MKNLIYVVLFLFLNAAHAQVTAICELNRSDSQEMEIPALKDKRRSELQEAPLVFVPQADGTWVAQLTFSYKLSPSYVTYLRVVEDLRDGKISWVSELKTVRINDGRIVAGEVENHEFQSADNKFTFRTGCDSYFKTDLNSSIQPLSPREQLRFSFVNGPGERREYIYENDEVDALDQFDLFRLLQNLPNKNSTNLRELVSRIERRGFTLTPWGPETGHEKFVSTSKGKNCSSGGSNYICDTQEFVITPTFEGIVPLEDGSGMAYGYQFVEIKGRILRDSKSRQIREYQIISVRPWSVPDRPFGRASTSGGRITGR